MSDLAGSVLAGLCSGFAAAVLDTRQALPYVGGWPGPLLIFLQAVSRLTLAGATLAALAWSIARLGAVVAGRLGRKPSTGSVAALTVTATPGLAYVAVRLFQGGATSRLPARPLLVAASLAVMILVAVALCRALAKAMERADEARGTPLSAAVFAAILLAAGLGMRWCDAHMYRRLYLYLHGVLAFGTLAAPAVAFRLALFRGPGRRASPRLAAILLGVACLLLAVARPLFDQSQVVKVAAHERTATLGNLLAVFSGRRVAAAGPRPSAALRRLVYEREKRARAVESGPWPSFPGANVILVSIDALRADRLGVYGHDGGLTSRLDEWARSAVVFERAYCPAPHSSYSISSMHTSRYLHDEAALGRPIAHPTLAEILGRAGYATSAFYTQGIFFTEGEKVGHYRRTRFGFADVSQGAPRPGELADNVIAEIEGLVARGEPAFFLWAHFFNVHEPYLSTRFGTSPRARYDGEIFEADLHVRRILDYARDNLARDTIVVVTSDHGEEFKDHGGYYHGSTLYDEQIRVPLLIRAPGAEPRRVSAPVSTLDIAPTVLALVGLVPPPDMAGNDLRPAIFGGDESHVPRPVFSSVLKRHAVVRWPHKLVADSAERLYELYDLAADPGERVNLYDKKRALATELMQEIEVWLEGIGRGEDEAATALNMGRLRDRRAVDGLLAVAANPSAPAEERVEALRLVGEIRETAVAKRIRRLLDDQDQRVVTAAALALGDLGDGSGADVLRDALYDEDPEVRDRAALALGRLKDRDAVPALVEALGRDDLGVRERAIRLLGDLGDDRAVEPLIEIVPEERTRYLAVLALGLIGDPRAYDTLMDVLEYDTHTDVRGYAVVALGWLGLPRAVPRLLRVLREEPEIKWTAESLVRLGAVGRMPLFGADAAPGEPALIEGFGACDAGPERVDGTFLGRTTCRTTGPTAQIRFTAEAPDGAEILFRARHLVPNASREIRLDIEVDGAKIGEAALSRDFEEFRFPAPSGTFASGQHAVRLRLAESGRFELDHFLVLASQP